MILRRFLVNTLLLLTVTFSEESSILGDCTMIARDISTTWSHNANAVCDGGFKSMAHTTGTDVGGNSKEIVVQLSKAKKIMSAFVQNRATSVEHKRRMGESAIFVGEDSGAFSAGMTKCSADFFDSGLYEMTCNVEGKHVAVRRNGPSSALDIVYNINEMRLYQTKNLLERPNVTISAPAPTAPKWAATNLITNPTRRTPGNNKPPFIDKAGTTATWESCFKTSVTQLAAIGHKLVLSIDLGAVYFQHAILTVQDVFTGAYPLNVDHLLYFQNYEIYVGNSPVYAENPKCPDGPYMQTNDAKSYVDVSIMDISFIGSMWKFGSEIWCNMEGRYMSIVADLSHLAGLTSLLAPTGYQMNLCHLAVYGALYKRNTPAPSTTQLLISKSVALEVEKIAADSSTPIGNSLNIMLRQKAGTELPWVTFTQDALVTKVNIAPGITVNPGIYSVILESFDLDGGVFSALKTDTITVTVLPLECGQPLVQSVAFETTQPIVLVQEYQPIVYFPAQLFAGPHTFTGYACGGTYTQSITMDTPVTGVVLTDSPTGPDLRPFVAIGSSAGAGIAFTLTFSGRYVYLPTQTDINASFTQTFQIKSVFSTDYLDQPTISHSLTAADLTFTVPPAAAGTAPPTLSLAASSFAVAYPIKTAITDALGNTPPAIAPVPYSGFSSTQLVNVQTSLGMTTLTSPQGSLTAVGFNGQLSPGSTLLFTCDPWSTVTQGTTKAKSLNFANSVVSAFTASFSVACVNEASIRPGFASALATQTLTSGVAQSWTLPSITEGSFGPTTIKFEPASNVATFLQFDLAARTVFFNGALFQETLTSSSVNIFLIDSAGQQVSLTQALVLLQAPRPCSLDRRELEILTKSLSAEPLRLEAFAGQLDFKIVSYKSQFDQINAVKAARNCANLTVKLDTKHSFLKLEPEGYRLTLLSDPSTVEGTFEDSSLAVTLDAYSLQIPIAVEFKACIVTGLAFGQDVISVAYTLGTEAQRENLPKVVQTPDCGPLKQEVEIRSIVSSLSNQMVRSAVTLDKDKSALVIETEDASFAGKWASVIIAVDAGANQTAKPLVVTIFFVSNAAVAQATENFSTDLVELDYGVELGSKLGIPNFVVPLVTKQQKDLLKTLASPQLSGEQLFKSVPLAARLTQGVDSVKQLADEQLAIISNDPETATLDSSPPEARFERLTSSGLLHIKFTHSLLFPNGTLEEIQTEIAEHKNKTQADQRLSHARVQLYVVRDYEPEDEQDEGFILQNWELVALDKDSMQIQCFFFVPLKVSQQEEPDLLMIQLELSQYKDVRGKALPESLVKYQPIPLQLASADDTFFIDKFGAATAGISIGLLTGSGLLLIVLKVVVSRLWSIINCLQVVQKQNLFDVRVPANVFSFMNFFTSLSSLEIETPWLHVENLYYFPEQKALNLNFQNAGFTTSFALINLQQPLLVLCGYLALVVFWSLIAVMSRCCPKYCSCRDGLTRLLFWNGLLRIVIEGFADFTMFALLNLSRLEWSSLHKGVNVSNYVSISSISLMGIVPTAFFIYSLCRRDSWATQSYDDRAGTFLAGTSREKREKRWAVLSVPLLFFGRRWALSAMLVFLDTFFVGQIATQLVSSTLMLSVMHWSRPLESPYVTWRETFNEEVSLMISYLLMNYSNFLPDPEMRYKLGFAHIGLFCLLLLVHLSLIAWGTGHLLILNCRRCKSRGWCYCCKRKRPHANRKSVKKAEKQRAKSLSEIEEASEVSNSGRSEDAPVGGNVQRRVVPADTEFEQSHVMISTSAKILLERSILSNENVRRPRITIAADREIEEVPIEGGHEDYCNEFDSSNWRQPRQDSNEYTYEKDSHVRQVKAEATRAARQAPRPIEVASEPFQQQINAGARDFDQEWSLYQQEIEAYKLRQ